MLHSAGIDLNKFAQSLRLFDRTRMMVNSIKTIINRQRSLSFGSILKCKIKRTKALENASNRMKARLLLNFNEVLRTNKTPQKYFYSWFLKSNPQILQKFAWNLLMKQKLNTKVASSRLLYLCKFKTRTESKINYLKILTGLSSLEQFIQMKRVFQIRNAWNVLSPFCHNGKYYVLQKVWKRYTDRRIDNKKKVLSELRDKANKVKRMMQLLFTNLETRGKEAFRKLREFVVESDVIDSQIKDNLLEQKKRVMFKRMLKQGYKDQSREAFEKLRENKNQAQLEHQRKIRLQKKMLMILGGGIRGKLVDAFYKLQQNNSDKIINEEKHKKNTSRLCLILDGLHQKTLRGALKCLNDNARSERIKNRAIKMLLAKLTVKKFNVLDKLGGLGKAKISAEKIEGLQINGAVKMLLGRNIDKLKESFLRLRLFARLEKEEKNLTKGKTFTPTKYLLIKL